MRRAAIVAIVITMATSVEAYEPLPGFPLLQETFGFDLFGVRNGSFCREYHRIVLTRDDLAQIRGIPRTLRDRIQANDLNYLCRCEGFRSAWCNGVLP
jgi:putative lipase involved disintegration of autophagic bodies